MGSFDATCIVSDIGISCGDNILCVLLTGHKVSSYYGNRSWQFSALPIKGIYDDYGRILLNKEEDVKKTIDILRPYIIPREQGQNKYHEQRVNPDTLTWDELQDLDYDRRLFVDPNRKPSEAESFQLATQIEELLIKNQIKVSSCYAVKEHATIVCIELPWEQEAQDKLIPEISSLLLTMNLNTMVVPSPSRSQTGPHGPQKALLIAPNMNAERMIDFGFAYEIDRMQLTRGFILEEVYDALIPIDEQVLEIAQLLKDKLVEYHDMETSDPELARFKSPYFFENNIKRLRSGSWRGTKRIGGIHFTNENGFFGGQRLIEQIVSLPIDCTIEDLVPFVRIYELQIKMQYSLRRGIRPTLDIVGSQLATEDWPEQKSFHKLCASILNKKIKRSNR